MTSLNASVTNCTGLESITITSSHGQSCTTATIECENTTLNIGGLVVIGLGDNVTYNANAFTGYVKQIDYKHPDKKYSISCVDLMTRAIDYFITSDDPNVPLTYLNINAETLFQNVMSLAGLTTFDVASTGFTYATNGYPVTVSLTSAYDFCKQIADTLSWHMWCDSNGTIHFKNRKPFYMNDTSRASEPDWVQDTLTSPTAIFDDTQILDIQKQLIDKDLRNKVVVWGSSGIQSTASAASSYLPAGYYRTILFSNADMVTRQVDADHAANYNLYLYNRLTTVYDLTIIGNANIQAHNLVRVTDTILPIGKDVDLYVYACTHQWSKGGFTTKLDLR